MKNNKVKRTILMLLVSVIVFAATMAIPALQGSKWKVILQGCATGLIMAGVVSIITLIIDYLKDSKK